MKKWGQAGFSIVTSQPRHLLAQRRKPRRIRKLRDLAQEIVEDLEAALEQCREIAVDLRANSVSEQDP